MTRLAATGSIKTLNSEDKDKVRAAMHAILLSFAADPMMRWMVPETSDYIVTMPEIFQAFAGKAIESGSAYVSERGHAVALWLPPGAESDSDRMSAALQRVVPVERREDISAIFTEMNGYHPNDQPCWYLPLIGVDPATAHQGLGSALMRHALQVCDEAELPAYLDSSNPRNIPFYERLGFRVTGEIQHGTSPVIYPMLRNASGS